MTKRILCFLGLLAISLCASAEIYRWVDAQGHVHYSDRPVPGAQRVVGVKSHSTDREAVAEQTAAQQQQEQADQAAAAKSHTDQTAAKNVDKDMAKLQEERCKKAKEDYRIATESQRLYRIGKNGEREYLTNEEITAARISARKALDEACGKQNG